MQLNVPVKSELNSNGEHLLGEPVRASVGPDGLRCVKRRRGGPALLSIINDSNGQTLDQSATTSTIKRSSRFRGVSRKSNGFSRGVSKYRRVARHHHNGRWEARIGRVFGNKYLYLSTYSTQEEAARAYDIAAIEYRGINAVTNFDLSTYIRWLRPGGDDALSSSQKHHSNGVHRSVQPSTILQDDEADPLLHHNYVMEGMNSECKQEFMSHQMFGSGSCNRSSPTALSLLLRSSMFKKLKEKNSNACNEMDRNEPEDEQRQLISGDDCCEIYFQGIANAPPICSPNENKASVEQQEGAAIHEHIEQFFWNCLDSVVDDTATDYLDHPSI